MVWCQRLAITAAGVGYFTVDGAEGVGEVDWDWFAAQPELSRKGAARRIRLATPLKVIMDGHTGKGVIVHGENGQTTP